MTLFAVKFVLAPLCVVLVSMAGRRWGLAVAGALGSLPVVAIPILLVISLENGSAFGAEAAASAVMGLVALTAFVVVYGLVAQRFGPYVSLALGWSAFLVCIALLDFIPHAALPALVLACLSFVLGLKLLPAPRDFHLAPTPPPWWDLPLRALTALGLVVTISAVASLLGPKLSGLLTPFPIITAVLAAFTQVQGDSRQVILLFRGFLIGFYSYAVFCFVVAITVDAMPIGPSFLLGILASVVVQLSIFSVVARRSGLAG